MNQYGNIFNVFFIFDFSFLDYFEYLLFKISILLICTLIQKIVLSVSSTCFTFVQSQVAQIVSQRRFRRNISVNAVFFPVISFTVICAGLTLILAEIFDENRILALAFVVLNWLLLLLSQLYMRTFTSMFVFHNFSKQLMRFLLIYIMSFYGTGFCLELIALSGLILFTLCYFLYVFWELPAFESGEINHERIRFGMVIRRVQVQMQQGRPP
jgi:hypothetical protein